MFITTPTLTETESKRLPITIRLRQVHAPNAKMEPIVLVKIEEEPALATVGSGFGSDRLEFKLKLTFTCVRTLQV